MKCWGGKKRSLQKYVLYVLVKFHWSCDVICLLVACVYLLPLMYTGNLLGMLIIFFSMVYHISFTILYIFKLIHYHPRMDMNKVNIILFIFHKISGIVNWTQLNCISIGLNQTKSTDWIQSRSSIEPNRTHTKIIGQLNEIICFYFWTLDFL